MNKGGITAASPISPHPPPAFPSSRSRWRQLLVRPTPSPFSLHCTYLHLLFSTVTPAEASFFPSLFTKFQKNGSINGQSAFELLPLSDVPLPVLGEIWGIADPQDKGALDVAGWTVAMRLISVAQRGGDVTPDAGEQRQSIVSAFFARASFLLRVYVEGKVEAV